MTSHVGLGHAARDSAIAEALLKLKPDFKIRFLTAQPAMGYLLKKGFRVHESSYKLESFSRAVEEFLDSRVWFLRLRGWASILKRNYSVLVEDRVFDEPDVIVADEFWEVMLAGDDVKSRVIFITDLLSLEPAGSLLKKKLYARINDYLLTSFRKFNRVLYTAYYSDNPMIDRAVSFLGKKLLYIGPVSSITGCGFRREERDGTLHVLVVNGGTSARARVFLEKCVRMLKKLSARRDVEAKVVTGPRTSLGARDYGFKLEILGFKAGLEEELSESDLVVTRAGRTTIADLECLGVKALLVPIKNHIEQERLALTACNRRPFFKYCSEDGLDSEECISKIEELVREQFTYRDYFSCKGAYRAALAIKSIATGSEPPTIW